MGTVTQENLQVQIGHSVTPGNFALSNGRLRLHTAQTASQRLMKLAAGESQTVFWQVTYPATTNVGYPYTIWANTTTGCKSSQNSQFKTQRELSTSANKLQPTGAMILVNPPVVAPACW